MHIKRVILAIFLSFSFISISYAGYAFIKERDNTVARKFVADYLGKEFATENDEITYLRRSEQLTETYISHNLISTNVKKVKGAYEKKIEKLLFEKFQKGYGKPIEGLGYISRQQWGADETFTYPETALKRCPSGNCWGGNSSDRTQKIRDNYTKNFKESDEATVVRTTGSGGALFEYYPIKQIILHHTAGQCPKTVNEEKEEMRKNYETHALSFGWGDFGYHYAIGPSGTIYEGRKGGAYVAGFHAVGHNAGSIGITLMGDGKCMGGYTKLQMDSLRNLTVSLSKFYVLDISKPTKQRDALLTGEVLGNTVIAHKEIDDGKPVDPDIDMGAFRKSLIEFTDK